MKIKPLDLVVCRTPAFAFDDKLEDIWEQLKDKIRESSPDFYHQIVDLDYSQLSSKPPKLQFTVWKYFNRARFRATPYGSFASFTTLPIGKDPENIVLSREMVVHRFRDWPEDFEKAGVKFNGSLEIRRNPTSYEYRGEIRYISHANDQFVLSAIELTEEIELIFSLSLNRIKCDELINAIHITLGVAAIPRLRKLIMHLIDIQFLQSSRFRNITGKDYFERMGIAIGSGHGYQLSERNLVKGFFALRFAEEIAEFISFMANYKKSYVSPHLEFFKKRFREKFGERSIPLLLVMDPEIGLGYADLEHGNDGDELVDFILSHQTAKAGSCASQYSQLHIDVLNQLASGKEIHLSENNIKKSGFGDLLPNSLSVMVGFSENKPVIRHIGGATANALLGRFTIASPEIESFCKSVSALEIEANPGTLFFDVAYQAERNVDNVNRRINLYEAELPINSWSDCEGSINFADILVTVDKGQVIFQHRVSGRRMMPRIPSAYNQMRSDLSLFRFVCDVQNQLLQVDLTFQLSDLFPDLDHYPRVYYKNLIVSPATWKVPETFLLGVMDVKTKIQLFRKWLVENGVSMPFKTGHADQMMVFDPLNDMDLISFFNFSKTSSAVIITESLLDASSFVKDEKNRSYVPEYVLSFAHGEQIYPPLRENRLMSWPMEVDELEMIGDKWLYLDIYCGCSSANLILLKIMNAIGQQAKSLMNGWFFIRYKDPKTHLRLRLRTRQKNDVISILPLVNSIIMPEIQQGMIEDITIRPYRRELGRYGKTMMDQVEDFFCTDSTVVLSLLNKNSTMEQLYSSAIQFMMVAYQCFIPDPTDSLLFTRNMADLFSKEFELGTNSYKKINERYKAHFSAQTGKNLLSKQNLGRLRRRLKLLSSSCPDAADKRRLLSDLIHLHINRLFSSEQRIHEAILYQYMLKSALSKRFHIQTK